MTLVQAWVRQNATLKELVIVSDSRVTGGESWDVCPKIVALSRPATVMAIAGDATAAYAFLVQAINTVSLLDGTESGRTDIRYLSRKLHVLYRDLRNYVSDLPINQSKPDTPNIQVGLYGWSWRRLRFEGYMFYFDRHGVVQKKSIPFDRPLRLHAMGDAASDARRQIYALRQSSNASGSYDWEPLVVLDQMVRDSNARTVGGVPQILRIYQYGEVEPFVWRNHEGEDHFGGRPVQAAERFDRRIMQLVNGVPNITYSDRSIQSG